MEEFKMTDSILLSRINTDIYFNPFRSFQNLRFKQIMHQDFQNQNLVRLQSSIELQIFFIVENKNKKQ